MRGLTLLETLLAVALAMLGFSLCVQGLLPVLRYSSRTTARADVVQAATLVSRRLVSDLEKAPMEGMSLANATVFSIQAAGNLTDTGIPVWDSQIVVYAWNEPEKMLETMVWQPAGLTPEAPTPQAPQAILAALNRNDPTYRYLGRGMLTDFSLRPNSATQSMPLHLRMRFEIDTPGRTERYEHEQSILLRAGGSS